MCLIENRLCGKYPNGNLARVLTSFSLRPTATAHADAQAVGAASGQLPIQSELVTGTSVTVQAPIVIVLAGEAAASCAGGDPLLVSRSSTVRK
jgi:hypothetical protein